jgi:hypothetical protein
MHWQIQKRRKEQAGMPRRGQADGNVQQRRQQEIRLLSQLREGLSRPGVLDRLRARRAEAWARQLLLMAYRLGLGDSPR